MRLWEIAFKCLWAWAKGPQGRAGGPTKAPLSGLDEGCGAPAHSSFICIRCDCNDSKIDHITCSYLILRTVTVTVLHFSPPMLHIFFFGKGRHSQCCSLHYIII